MAKSAGKSPATTDISDDHGDAVRVLDAIFADFGGVEAFHGPVKTLKCFEDNAKVRQAVESPGNGQVLVVDGGGSERCALFGGNLAELAEKNGWAGVVVYGFIRDWAEIETFKIGMKALGTHPKKSVKADGGTYDVPVTFAGHTIKPGDWLYADRDGVVVADKEL
ncbi:ribonuclease E activity regulator RraA [Pyruvatibacter sp.]|uniref:ribonuclease E activity regulator RraA n=1 Tax=Pyruvatibacter sp. TaxID=1981328 RepID=UPI0032EBB171